MSFVLTKHTLLQAASDIRAAQKQLEVSISQLRHHGMWSGHDAERFLREWDDQVNGPLHAAAVALETTSYVTMV